MFNFVKQAADSLKSAAQNVVTNVTAATAQPVQIGDRMVAMKEQLGEGGFAYVSRVEDANTGQPMAMKRMLCQDKESRDIAEKEIAMMRMLKGHPNIIQFIASSKRENTQSSQRSMEYFILMELCNGGNLYDLIRRRNGQKLGEAQVYSVFLQTCKAVQYLHHQNPPIAHRDIKLENFLVGQNNVIKLCDFGSCCTRRQVYSTQKEIVEEEEIIGKYSTQMYRAPEMCSLSSSLKKQMIDEKVDIWALGCILFTLAFYTHPFQDGGNLQIIAGNYQVPESHPYSKYVTALIKRLLTVEREKRPDIDQVMNLLEQWNQWLKGGGVTTAAKSAGTTTTSAHVMPSSAVTDPARSHIKKDDDSTVPQSAKLPKERKAKKVKKSSKSASATTSAAAADDDWADFSAAPKATSSKPPAPSSSDDSSSDDDAPPPPAKAPSRSTSSSSTSSAAAAAKPAAAPVTASLFDLSTFGEIAPAASKPQSNNNDWADFGNASASHNHNSSASNNHHNDDWASFDSAPVASASAAPNAKSPTSSHSANSHSSFDAFDFSGMASATPPPVHSTPTPGSANRKSRHHDKKSESIDVSKLSVGRQTSHSSRREASDSSDSEVEDRRKNNNNSLGKITIKPPTQK